jgi:hypothetical protein
VEHGVEVVAVIMAGTGGGSDVRSDVLFCIFVSESQSLGRNVK